MWAGTGLSLSAGSLAAALPSWRSVVGGLPLGLAAAIEEKRAGGGEGSFHACVLLARNPVSDRPIDKKYSLDPPLRELAETGTRFS